LSTYQLTEREKAWVTQLEPLITEFAAGLEPEETEDWYLECAEILCDLAHAYCKECERNGTEPLFETLHDRVMLTLAVKICCADQLTAALDAFHCKGKGLIPDV
jgi:hypothetical protein